MIIYQYLDALPPVPAHLAVSPAIPDESQIGFQDGLYTRWSAQPELVEWIRENITEEIKLAGVQTIGGDVPLHCDKRKWALNYLVDLGGPNVVTGFHKLPHQPVMQPPATRAKFATDAEEITSTTFTKGRWHLLNTNVLHSVTGVTGKRVAITIGFNADNPFSVIKGYAGLLS